MNLLVSKVKELFGDVEVKGKIDFRINSFRDLNENGTDDDLFFELCFCLLTANFSAKRAIEIHEQIGFDGFIGLSQEGLALKLRELGYRFPNKRAEYVVLVRNLRKGLREKLFLCKDDFERRRFLVENIKGIGMKEASHYLRNVGFFNVAILDFHIVDILAQNNVIRRPFSKSLSPRVYLEIEEELLRLARACGLTQGELDYYLWYLETGEILK